MSEELTDSEKKQVAIILRRRANEIASFNDEYRSSDSHLDSVSFALTMEIDRLRELTMKVNPSNSE